VVGVVRIAKWGKDIGHVGRERHVIPLAGVLKQWVASEELAQPSIPLIHHERPQVGNHKPWVPHTGDNTVQRPQTFRLGNSLRLTALHAFRCIQSLQKTQIVKCIKIRLFLKKSSTFSGTV
jgi:hypothetical protein